MAPCTTHSTQRRMDGAITERFNDALSLVLANVYDLNTDPEKVRKISLIVKIKPNKRRDAAEFKTEVKVEPVPPVALVQTVLMA